MKIWCENKSNLILFPVRCTGVFKLACAYNKFDDATKTQHFPFHFETTPPLIQMRRSSTHSGDRFYHEIVCRLNWTIWSLHSASCCSCQSRVSGMWHHSNTANYRTRRHKVGLVMPITWDALLLNCLSVAVGATCLNSLQVYPLIILLTSGLLSKNNVVTPTKSQMFWANIPKCWFWIFVTAMWHQRQLLGAQTNI